MASDTAMTYGMEVEQCEGQLPHNFREFGSWHRDPSGPQESVHGPAKKARELVDEIDHNTPAPWTWTATTGHDDGCGSHVHLGVDFLEMGVGAQSEEAAEIWATAFNTMLEATPLLAPFFAHNWQDGFRDGTGSIERWASPTTQRKSVETVKQHMGPGSRNYRSVTFSGSGSMKPLTLELRLNDAHPTMAISGAWILSRLVSRAVARGNSPKSVDNAPHSAYGKVYQDYWDMDIDGLIGAMKEPVSLEYDRSFPGCDATFGTVGEGMRSIIDSIDETPPMFVRKAIELATEVDDPSRGPTGNNRQLFDLMAGRTVRWRHE